MANVRIWMIVVLCSTLAWGTASSQPNDMARTGVLATLKVGQAVALKDVGERYQITTMDEVTPQTHSVVEIGSDYAVLKDLAEVTELRIPLTSIKAVVVNKNPQSEQAK